MNRIDLDANPQDFLIWRQGSGTTVEIFDIAVNSHRRKGCGRRLINILIDQRLPYGTTLVWAITRSTNLIAQSFYEQTGFHVIAVLRRFYSQENGADAIMFGIDVLTKKEAE